VEESGQQGGPIPDSCSLHSWSRINLLDLCQYVEALPFSPMPPRCSKFYFLVLNTTYSMYTSRDKIVINSKAVVCQDVELRGDITIGPGGNIRHKYWTEQNVQTV